MTEAEKDKPAVALADGMNLVIDTVKNSLEKEAPIQETEQFDLCFHSPSIWRQPGESMQAYIVRRGNELAKLDSIASGGCTRTSWLPTCW